MCILGHKYAFLESNGSHWAVCSRCGQLRELQMQPSEKINVPSLNEICVEAVNKMVGEEINKHVQFISSEDNTSFGLKEGGKIPKVTIEWVEASEADPDKFKDG